MAISLALDLATSCGYAYRHGAVATSGVWKLPSGDGRFLGFWKRLSELHATYGIAEIGYERPQGHNGDYAAMVGGGFIAIVILFADLHGIPSAGLHQSTLKKVITGSGKASKADVCAVLVRDHAFVPTTLVKGKQPHPCYDESDAFAVLVWMEGRR